MKKLLVAAALMAAAPVFAQMAAPSQFYIGIDGGRQKLDINENPAGGGIVPKDYRNSKTTARLFGGYQFTPNWAAELGYLSSNYAFVYGDGEERTSINARFKGFDVGVTYKFTEGLPGLFLKAGISRFKSDYSYNSTLLSTAVTTPSTQSQSGTGPLFGIGYETNITGNLDGHIGYTQYNKLAGDGDVKLKLYYVGLKYRF